MRLLTPILFAAIFIVWVLYRLFIKKDLRQHLNDVYFGLFFMGVWALLYWFWFS